jgi:hypothetical protein
VARAQTLLLAGDRDALRALLASWPEWPHDASVLRWVDRLQHLCGMTAQTTAASA